MTKLGVNIDHVATIRQARKTIEPDPIAAAFLADLGGADGITIHLREDRRHIQDRDLRLLRQVIFSKLNLEMAVSEEIINIALEVKPDQITLVPEKRTEITTEGGLDVKGNSEEIAKTVERFKQKGIVVSLFIDAEEEQIRAASDTGTQFIELHTGNYANAIGEEAQNEELEKLKKGANLAREIGIRVNAGHGLTYRNTGPIVANLNAEELNIGHSIVSRAIFVGLERAVREMKEIIEKWDLKNEENG